MNTGSSSTLGADAESVAPAMAPVGLKSGADALWIDLRALAHDHLELVALESQRAGEGLVAILLLILAIGALVASAWVGVLVLLVMLVTALGSEPALAVALVLAVNVGGAFLCARAVRRYARYLSFPATRGALRGIPGSVSP